MNRIYPLLASRSREAHTCAESLLVRNWSDGQLDLVAPALRLTQTECVTLAARADPDAKILPPARLVMVTSDGAARSMLYHEGEWRDLAP